MGKDLTTNTIPGAAALGYGFNVATATHATKFTQQIINPDEKGGSPIEKFGVPYILPANVSEIDINQGSTSFSSFNSESQYSEYMSTKASGEGDGWGFSTQFEMAYSDLSTGSEKDFYGLVEATTILWITQLKSITGNTLNADFISALNKLPSVFNTGTQLEYFAFFDTWGTHVVNQTSVGGYLNYIITSGVDSGLSESAASASMQFEYDALFADVSANAEASWNSMSSTWISTRKSKLNYAGGTSEVLSGFVPPSNPVWDPNNSLSGAVNAWSETLDQNPSVVSTSITPLPNVLSGYGSNDTEKTRFKMIGNQLATALEVYLFATIQVSVTCQFSGHNLQASTASIFINEGAVAPRNPPRMTDLSMYWVVLADENGNVVFNTNFNTEDPGDFDIIAQSAKDLTDSGKYWVCVALVNQSEAPLSIFAINWLGSIGIDTSTLGYDEFYTGQCGVATMIGKSNCSYVGQTNHYMPVAVRYPYNGYILNNAVTSSAPAFINLNKQ